MSISACAFLTGALVPAAPELSITRRICEFLPARQRPMRPVAAEIRDWIVEQMRSEIAAIDARYPALGLVAACY